MARAISCILGVPWSAARTDRTRNKPTPIAASAVAAERTRMVHSAEPSLNSCQPPSARRIDAFMGLLLGGPAPLPGRRARDLPRLACGRTHRCERRHVTRRTLHQSHETERSGATPTLFSSADTTGNVLAGVAPAEESTAVPGVVVDVEDVCGAPVVVVARTCCGALASV